MSKEFCALCTIPTKDGELYCQKEAAIRDHGHIRPDGCPTVPVIEPGTASTPIRTTDQRLVAASIDALPPLSRLERMYPPPELISKEDIVEALLEEVETIYGPNASISKFSANYRLKQDFMRRFGIKEGYGWRSVAISAAKKRRDSK